jgi:hypothetical protein
MSAPATTAQSSKPRVALPSRSKLALKSCSVSTSHNRRERAEIKMSPFDLKGRDGA